jgi:hypothetical protein
LKAHLFRLISGLGEAMLDHERYDAIVAACTACLHGHGATELVGDDAEGRIAQPRDPAAPFDKT